MGNVCARGSKSERGLILSARNEEDREKWRLIAPRNLFYEAKINRITPVSSNFLTCICVGGVSNYTISSTCRRWRQNRKISGKQRKFSIRGRSRARGRCLQKKSLKNLEILKKISLKFAAVKKYEEDKAFDNPG